MSRYMLISTDGHAGLPPERYRDYLEARYHQDFDEALPRQIRAAQMAEEKFLIKDFNDKWRQGIEKDLTGAWDGKQRNKVLDQDGVVSEVLYPDGITELNAPPFGAGLSLKTWDINPELQWAGARAHNRWMAEFCADDPLRRLGLAIIPLVYDIDLACKEIRAAKEKGMKGILIPSIWGDYPAYNDPVYDPVWRLCEDLNMVVHTHAGPCCDMDFNLPGAMGVFLMEFHWWAARPLWTMLMGGVFERFPGLRLVITEVNEFWIPEMIRMMDIRASVKHTSGKLGDFRSHLTMTPGEYFRRNCRVGASAKMDKESVDARYGIGVSCLMWGTDYPHPEGTWPTTRQQMIECFKGLPEEELEAILGKNAVELYDLDGAACRALADKIGPEKALFA